MLKASEAQELFPPVKGSTRRSELLKLVSRWDGAGRLYIARRDETNELDMAEVFGILKHEATEMQMRSVRQIVHRKRRNHRVHPLGGYGRRLPHATLFNSLPLGSDFAAVGSMDDLNSFFHYFEAMEAKALSNLVGPSAAGVSWRSWATFASVRSRAMATTACTSVSSAWGTTTPRTSCRRRRSRRCALWVACGTRLWSTASRRRTNTHGRHRRPARSSVGAAARTAPGDEGRGAP